MRDIAVAERYSKALFELAKRDSEIDINLQGLKTLSELFEREEIKKFLKHPSVDIKEKIRFLDGLFGKEFPQTLMNFLKLLIEKKRINILPYVKFGFEELVNKEKNIINALVKVPFELSQKDKSEIKKGIEKIYNKKVNMSVVMDESIVGGIILKVGDRVFDNSIKAQLDRLRGL